MKSSHLWRGGGTCHRCGLERKRTKVRGEWSYLWPETGRRSTRAEEPQCVQRDMYQPAEYTRKLVPSTPKEEAQTTEFDAWLMERARKRREGEEEPYTPGTAEDLISSLKDLIPGVEVISVTGSGSSGCDGGGR